MLVLLWTVFLHNCVILQPDVALPLQPPELLKCPTRNSSLSTMHNLLHDEIDSFCKRVSGGFSFFGCVSVSKNCKFEVSFGTLLVL